MRTAQPGRIPRPRPARVALPALLASMLLLCSLAVAPAAPAQNAGGAGGMAAMLSPEMGQQRTHVSYRHEYAPPAWVEGGAAELGSAGHRLALTAPLAQGQAHELALSARVDLLELDTTAVLPDSRLRLPERLWDLRLGGLYRTRLEGGMIAGLSAEAGSPSDKPFRSGDELSLNATAFLRLPQGPRDAWLFFLNYDHNREFLSGLPLPGVAYRLAPSPDFQALLGAPFLSLRWLPARDWEVAAVYAMPYSLRARLTHRLGDHLRPYLGFDWSSRRWFLADRAHRENRLFFWEKRLALGLGLPLAAGMEADLALGWAFDRLLFQGENHGDRHQDRLDLENGAFVSAQVGWRF